MAETNFTMELLPAYDANLFSIEQLDALNSQLRTQPQSYLAFVQYLPTLVQNLQQAVQKLHLNQNKLLNGAIPELYQLQRISEISTPNQTEIESKIKELSKQFPVHFSEVSHLIKFGQRLQAVMQSGNQIQSCDPAIINALQSAFQILPSMRSTLILRSLIVTIQPNSVMKKGNLFTTEVRLLLDIAAASPSVRIRIIALSDAEKLNAGQATCNQVSYEATIVNNQASFEKKGEALISVFAKQPTLKEIGTRGQTGTAKKLAVTEQKFVLLYEILSTDAVRSALGYSGSIWALSHPIILIVHANQFCDAYGTIVWDRAFKDEEQVEWARMCWLLTVTFTHLTGAKKRKLSDEDLENFRQKMNISRDMPKITYQRFAKDKAASGVKFSFWTWFHTICTLINSDLLPYWEKGCLMGFVSREEISSKLSSIGKPAFLLRFSDSQLGTISVSSFKHNSDGTMKHLPFLLEGEKLEKAGSLVELLRDFDQLRTVRYFCNKDYQLNDKGFFLEDPELQTKKKEADTGPTPTGYHKIRMVIKGGDDEDDDDEEKRKGSSTPMRMTHSPSEGMIQSPFSVSSSYSQDSFANQQHSQKSPYATPPQSVQSNFPNSPANNTNFSVSPHSAGGYFSQYRRSQTSATTHSPHRAMEHRQSPTSPAAGAVLDFFPDLDLMLDSVNSPSFQSATHNEATEIDDSYSSVANCIAESLTLQDMDDGDNDYQVKKTKRS